MTKITLVLYDLHENNITGSHANQNNHTSSFYVIASQM